MIARIKLLALADRYEIWADSIHLMVESIEDKDK